MSYIAFDLDNTLAYLFHVSPVAHFISVETMENSAHKAMNPGFRLSRRLRNALYQAEANFIQKIMARQHLVKTILRPNLDAMMRPVLNGIRTGRVRGVALYSNTENTFSMRLAIALIEARYDWPGLFCAAVDATNPIRAPDRERIVAGEPLKTYKVLKSIFTRFCGGANGLPIMPHNTIFVDERPMKHAVSLAEKDGLLYIQPTVYSPSIPRTHKKEILRLLLDVLHEEGLLYDAEYIESSVFNCMRRIYGTRRSVPIDSFNDLLNHVAQEIMMAGEEAIPFKDDTVALRRGFIRGLARN